VLSGSAKLAANKVAAPAQAEAVETTMRWVHFIVIPPFDGGRSDRGSSHN
jgi:hypothetical protein